jgi:putative hydrolase of the HAD superfamily
MIRTDLLKALIFDLDDTLVVEEASAEAAFLATCERARARYGIEPHRLHAAVRENCRRLWHAAPARPYCVEIGISSWEALWARFEGRDENLRVLRAWAPSYRRDSWQAALQSLGIHDPDFALELAEAYPVHRRRLHIVYEDVRPTLEHCRRFLRLALLTNGAPDLQREKIAGAGIAAYFDEIVISGEVGCGKPNRRIYEILLSRLGTAPHETLMIGNSLHSDVQGAQAVGMEAVWVNRSGGPNDTDIRPDLEMAGLEGLQRILTRG